ncbi:MAG: acyl-[acyl-carrier-protein]--UDP-N-acetylglucosamine O-acyltransferase [Leptospiraceae bacterium]|nr:MAG: acyl-[acyl-carrier-protein]--UDP-N-acetylglucosamine O-acyltransferase [Leptospiraceae bacterium]
MSNKIHPTAIISKTAIIEENVEIGPYVIIEDNVIIGKNTKIGAFCYIYANTQLGENNLLSPHVCLGGLPQDITFDPNKKTYLKIGNNNIFREFVNIHRSTKEELPTTIGDNNYFMGTVHLGHDCIVGNHNIFVQNCILAGHVIVGNRVLISGHVAIHQFCRIGDYSIIGGLSKIVKDVPPFMMVDGNPASVVGINVVGLKRNNFSEEQRRHIKNAYKILYKKGLTYSSAIEELKKQFSNDPNITNLISFIENSKRGILGAEKES